MILIDLFFAIIILSYTPFGVYQIYLIFYNSFVFRDYDDKKDNLKQRNQVILVTTTNGMATDVVEIIISTIDHYGLDVKQFVIKTGN